MANTYPLGVLVRCTGTFTDSNGANTDPTAVYCRVKTPAEIITTYTYGVDAELVKSAVGVYYIDVDAAAPGLWWYRFYSTGTGQAAREIYFRIDDSEFS